MRAHIFEKAAEIVVGERTSMSCWALAFALEPECTYLRDSLIDHDEFWLWREMHYDPEQATWFYNGGVVLGEGWDLTSTLHSGAELRQHLLLEVALNLREQGYDRGAKSLRGNKAAKRNVRRR